MCGYYLRKTGQIFFWLTGETPQTFMILVRILENRYMPFNNFGRNCVLDFRNQVYILLSYMKVTCDFILGINAEIFFLSCFRYC